MENECELTAFWCHLGWRHHEFCAPGPKAPRWRCHSGLTLPPSPEKCLQVCRDELLPLAKLELEPKLSKIPKSPNFLLRTKALRVRDEAPGAAPADFQLLSQL